MSTAWITTFHVSSEKNFLIKSISISLQAKDMLLGFTSMICHFIILNTQIESLFRNPAFSSFQGTRVSLEELNIFIILILTYKIALSKDEK